MHKITDATDHPTYALATTSKVNTLITTPTHIQSKMIFLNDYTLLQSEFLINLVASMESKNTEYFTLQCSNTFTVLMDLSTITFHHKFIAESDNWTERNSICKNLTFLAFEQNHNQLSSIMTMESLQLISENTAD